MSVLRGIVRLARFRAEGFAEFDTTNRAFLTSLVPLIVFPVLMQITQGLWTQALFDLFFTIVTLLTPLLVTEFLSRRWGRQALWVRFAVASNWCQWVLPAMLMVVLLVLRIGSHLGLPLDGNVIAPCLVVLALYGIVLQWFLARRGLDLSAGKAVLMVLAADLSTALLVGVPMMLESVP
jgi:hypothetical protein